MEIKPGINLRVFGKAFSSVCIILLAFMLMTPGHSTAQEISESDWLSITIYGGSIAVKAFSDDSKVISIDVVNPEDEIIHFETQGTWIALPYEVMQLNGHYQLEVQMVDKESGEIVDRLAGDFIIENGSVITRKRESPSSKWLPNQLGIFLKGIARTVTGLLVSEAQAADLFASGDNPTVFFDDTSNNYKSAEMANVAFLSNTLNPLLRKIETELLRKLIAPSLATKRKFQFDRRGLYACDLDSRVKYQTQTIAAGIYTVNEWRREENKEPVKGGDAVLVSANLRGINEALTAPAKPTTDNSNNNKDKEDEQ